MAATECVLDDIFMLLLMLFHIMSNNDCKRIMRLRIREISIVNASTEECRHPGHTAKKGNQGYHPSLYTFGLLQLGCASLRLLTISSSHLSIHSPADPYLTAGDTDSNATTLHHHRIAIPTHKPGTPHRQKDKHNRQSSHRGRSRVIHSRPEFPFAGRGVHIWVL
jgi:hypothetical protein